MVCSVQPVQDDHYEKWHVRFSCLSLPSVLHMAATRRSWRSSGFPTSQGSAKLMFLGEQSLLLLSAVPICPPLSATPV